MIVKSFVAFIAFIFSSVCHADAWFTDGWKNADRPLPPQISIDSNTKTKTNPNERQASPKLSEDNARYVYPLNKGDKFNMITTINECQRHHRFENFSEWVMCINLSYKQFGTSPDSTEANNFFALLDAIEEDYRFRKITFTKARAEMIEAWRNTIEAGNIARAQQVPQQQDDVWQNLGNAARAYNETIKRLNPPQTICTSHPNLHGGFTTVCQ